MSEFSDFVSNVRKSSPRFDEFLESVDVVLCTVVLPVTFSKQTTVSRMASEVMLAPTTTPGTSRREIDDVRDMVRNATVTTIYVSHEILYL